MNPAGPVRKDSCGGSASWSGGECVAVRIWQMLLPERTARCRRSRTHLASSSLWAAHDGNSTDIRPTPPRRRCWPSGVGFGCGPAPLGVVLEAPGTGREMDRFRCARSVRRPDRKAGCPDRIRRLRHVGACACPCSRPVTTREPRESCARIDPAGPRHVTGADAFGVNEAAGLLSHTALSVRTNA
jgi:hypothetical protein